jgi:four helix bundle protein
MSDIRCKIPMADKFRDLKVFKEAHALVLSVYKLTNGFPSSENFALTSQLRRSASSVAANIVEGNARNHKKEFIQFLYLSNGSLEETKYHVLLAHDLGYITNRDYKSIYSQAEIVGKMIGGLIKYLKI